MVSMIAGTVAAAGTTVVVTSSWSHKVMLSDCTSILRQQHFGQVFISLDILNDLSNKVELQRGRHSVLLLFLKCT